MVHTQPVVMHQLYMVNLIDNTAPLIYFYFFGKLSYGTRIYKQCVAWAASIPQLSQQKSLLLVSVKKQWHYMRQRPGDRHGILGLLWWRLNNDFKSSSNPSSQLQFCCTNPYSQVFQCQTHQSKCSTDVFDYVCW